MPIKYNDPDIIQHHLYDVDLKLFASPDYIKHHSAPKSLEDLANHRLIVFSGSIIRAQEINFHLKALSDVPYSFIKVNNGRSLRTSLLGGLGVGPFGYEDNLVNNNLLVDLFPESPPYKIPYYFTFHKRLKDAPKIKAFQEFLENIVKVW